MKPTEKTVFHYCEQVSQLKEQVQFFRRHSVWRENELKYLLPREAELEAARRAAAKVDYFHAGLVALGAAMAAIGAIPAVPEPFSWMLRAGGASFAISGVMFLFFRKTAYPPERNDRPFSLSPVEKHNGQGE